MKENSSENYLDQLLNSVNGNRADTPDLSDSKTLSSQEQWERDLFGDFETEEEITAKNEEDFLREFEAELLKDDMMSPFSDFESANEMEMDDTIDDIINHMSDIPVQDDIDPLVDENAEFEGKLPDEEELGKTSEADLQAEEQETAGVTMDEAVGAFDENLSSMEDDLQIPEANSQEGEELDLSGIGDSDLMDMLSDSKDLSELGDLLSSAEENRPIEEGDSIGDFAQAEMDAQEREAEEEEDEDASGDGKKNKKNKKAKKDSKEKAEKTGFFANLTKLLFGEDEEEEDTPEVSVDNTAGMSEENKKILAELEATGELEDSKKKKEKKKKEKKKKDPKPPKPKKVKEPKPKKEKKPKEVDNTPPLPKGPVVAIVIMAASLLGLILLGTNLIGYQANISMAKEQYERGSYVEAFSKMQGVKIKEKDEQFYQQMQLLSIVSKKYQNYLVFSNHGNDDIALDNLICAYGRYDLNKEKAQEAECSEEYEQLGGKIIKSLLEDYDMTGEEALEMYQSKNRKEYTLKLHAKLKALGLE